MNGGQIDRQNSRNQGLDGIVVSTAACQNLMKYSWNNLSLHSIFVFKAITIPIPNINNSSLQMWDEGDLLNSQHSLHPMISLVI